MPKTIGLGRGLASLIPGPDETSAQPQRQPQPTPQDKAQGAALDAAPGAASGAAQDAPGGGPDDLQASQPARSAQPHGGAPLFSGDGLLQVPVNDIRANPMQPRLSRGVEALKLEELAASIREHGVLEPVIVTRTARTGGPGAPYTLVAGERRWRAAQIAGLPTVPALLKDVAPQQMLELALIENIQRSDLNPLEEANAYQQLINDFGMTQDRIAERVGRSRVAITNTVRLLKLPGPIQTALMEGTISEGHARAILGLSSAVDQLAALDRIVKDDLNVRQAESLVRRMSEPPAPSQPDGPPPSRWEGAEEYESRLRARLGTRVSLQRSRKGGRIVIEFYSDEEFSSIYGKIVGEEVGD